MKASVLFGGYPRRGGPCGDTWSLRGGCWTKLEIAGPPPRDHHAMAFHEARGIGVMFGGWSGQRMLGDTWLWNGHSWAEQPLPGPSARGGVPAMTYDSDERKVLLYGGWSAEGPVQDLWQWDGEWTRIDSPACPASAAPPS